MQEDLARIEAKLDKALERLSRIDTRHATYTANQGEIVRRLRTVEKEVPSLKRHVAAVSGVAKALGLVSLAATIAAGIRQLIR